MKNSDNTEFISRKLDCLLLTAKVPKSTIKDVLSLSKPKIESDISKETLAKILQIRRTEERLLSRLDYWIYRENIEDFTRRKTFTSGCEVEPEEQKWDLDIHSKPMNNNHHGGNNRSHDEIKPIGRSVSSIETKSKTRKLRPWKNSAEKSESISMFHYNMKSSNVEDDRVSTTATLRTKIFTKFGTLPRKKLKMFFTKGNPDDDAKNTERKKENEDTKKPKETSFFSKYRRKDSRKEIASTSDVDKETVPRLLRRKPRPKSEAFDFDVENIAVNVGNMERPDEQASLTDRESSPFKRRLRAMPIFYVPPETKMI